MVFLFKLIRTFKPRGRTHEIWHTGGGMGRILGLILPDMSFGFSDIPKEQEEKILASGEYFKERVEFFKDAKYEKAIEKFKLSYEQVGPEMLILEAPLILYNIALSYDKAGKKEEAISYYKRYLEEAKKMLDISPEEEKKFSGELTN